MPTDLSAPIQSRRLRLVLLDREWLQAFADADPLPDRGFTDRYDFLHQSAHTVRMRLAQLADDPAQEPWLLRAVVLRETGEAIGYANFHAPPDRDGMVEIGYRIVAELRGRGYAGEAAMAMWRWAAEHGARVLRASVAPDNVPSLAIVRRAGFVEVGEQIDEIDGLELVFERPAEGI